MKSIKADTKHYLDYMIDTSFQGAKRLFVLSFKVLHYAVGASHTEYFLQKIEKNTRKS